MVASGLRLQPRVPGAMTVGAGVTGGCSLTRGAHAGLAWLASASLENLPLSRAKPPVGARDITSRSGPEFALPYSFQFSQKHRGLQCAPSPDGRQGTGLRQTTPATSETIPGIGMDSASLANLVPRYLQDHLFPSSSPKAVTISWVVLCSPA